MALIKYRAKTMRDGNSSSLDNNVVRHGVDKTSKTSDGCCNKVMANFKRIVSERSWLKKKKVF